MSRLTAPQATVTAAIAVFAVTGAIFTTRAESESVIDATDTTEAKIARASRPGHWRLHGSQRSAPRMGKGTSTMQSADLNGRGH